MSVKDQFNNITPFSFNDTVYDNSSQLVTNFINNANDTTGGYWFIIIIIVLFLWLIYILMETKTENLNYDMPRALLLASGICLILSSIAYLGSISITGLPIIWFSAIFFISTIAVMNRQNKNR